jgi:hypothetical protein
MFSHLHFALEVLIALEVWLVDSRIVLEWEGLTSCCVVRRRHCVLVVFDFSNGSDSAFSVEY